MNWKTFFQTIAAAVVAGGAQGAGQVLANSDGKLNWGTVGIGAAIGVIAYLTKSPIGRAQPEAPIQPPAAK